MNPELDAPIRGTNLRGYDSADHTGARRVKPSSARKAVSRLASPRVRILCGSAVALGPGKADLLVAIDETGSISGAARRMRMSYRRAWLLVHTMNECFRSPLVEAEKGGTAGGGARLTTIGREVLAHYHTMVQAAERHFTPYLRVSPPDANRSKAPARKRLARS